MYVIFEGIDTSGKSTQINLLKKTLKNAIFTKEPGGTGLGKKLRDLLLNTKITSVEAEIFLFLADRAQHYQEVILPNKDKLIISDRGFISGISYALANHPFLDIDFLIKLNQFALQNTFPDKIIFFETNEDLIIQRLDKKEKDFIEQRGIKYLLLVQENMKKIMRRLNLNFYTIDASKSIEQIQKQIKEILL